MMACGLSKELKKKYDKQTIGLRKGDEVRIMRGEFKGKKGKISDVILKKLKVNIEGMQRSKKDGTKVNVIFDPSNLQIIELNLEDKRRIAIVNRKSQPINSKEQNKEDIKRDNKKENKEKK